MGRDIKINPTGGTISFSGTNSTMINIDYNSGELNFNTHLGNDFKITSNVHKIVSVTCMFHKQKKMVQILYYL